MPSYKTHAIVGLAIGIALLMFICFSMHPCLTGSDILLLMLVNGIGSLFPDIDTKSKIQRPLYFALFFIFIALVAQSKLWYAVLVAFVSYIPLLVHHRSLLHRWSLYITLYAISIFLQYQVCGVIRYTQGISLLGLFFMCGALSHIALDTFVSRR